MIALKEDEAELVRLIAELGTASEVELQAKTLKSLKTLREELSDLEKHGIVRRRSGIFKSGFGDAVELTPDGYKSADRKTLRERACPTPCWRLIRSRFKASLSHSPSFWRWPKWGPPTRTRAIPLSVPS